MTRFGWSDFEEDESTDAIPGKYILTIGTVDENGDMSGDELFVIVHREGPGYLSIDGPIAEAKRKRAEALVAMLNEGAGWIGGDIGRYPYEAAESMAKVAAFARKVDDNAD